MREQDRAPAVARVDQPKVLRQVFSGGGEVALVATIAHDVRACFRWRVDRPRLPSRAAAADHRANRQRSDANVNACRGVAAFTDG
jgi:hypothetical protein